ncbi:lipopolysaccharide biosynthesis protein [Salegentibacter sp. HM20]
MGLIFKQSAKNLVTTYLGFGIGAINTLFLFTYFLEQQYYGLVSFLLSAANLIWPLMAFGVHSTLIKFFSSYKSRQEQDKLLNLVLFLPLLVSVFLGIAGWIGYDFLLDYFSEGNSLVQAYIWLIFVIAVATAYFEIFFAWSKLYYKSVFGNFMKEIFHRFCISILLFAVYFKWLSVESFIYAVALVFILRMLAMKIYAFRLHRPNLSIEFPANLSSVLKYSALILIAASVAMVLLDLDKVMIEHYLPIENVAIYGIAVYIATVISVPQKAMHQITHPLTAKMLNERDKKALGQLYTRSSLNLLIISGLIFVLILCNVRQLYEMIPDEYELSLLVIFLLSLVKLYDNFLGNNNSILFNSDYYRLVLGVGVILALLAFVFNLIFIPEFGIEGAAIASFLAFVGYNTTKIYLVYAKFKLVPFSFETLKVLILIAASCLVFFWWDFNFHPILNIALKSGIIVLGYLIVVFWFKFSEDTTRLLRTLLKWPKL